MSLIQTLLTRLSRRFILLDFVYDRDIYTMRKITTLGMITDEHIDNGRMFCERLLEPLVDTYGPVSFAAGICPDCGEDQLHSWTDSGGVAVDLVPHDWVNQEGSPISFLADLDQDNTIPFDRLIAYSGSEFSCVGRHADPRRNRFALYENIRVPERDPRRKKAFDFQGYGTRSPTGGRASVPTEPRPDWRRLKNQPIPHTQRSLRAQHIRLGRYHTLIDFCRNPYALHQGRMHVPWVEDDERFGRATSAIPYMRAFAEVLEPVVDAIGYVSIVRGYEPDKLHDDVHAPLHRWGAIPGERRARLVFFVSASTGDAPLAQRLLRAAPAIESIDVRTRGESSAIAIVLRDAFEPAKVWRSYAG